MSQFPTADDLEQLRRRGIPVEEIERQLAVFRHPPRPTRLAKACRPGDGIRRLEASDHSALEEAWRTAAAEGRFLKFVPASGAATRMFSFLRPLLEKEQADTEDSPEIAAFVNGARRLPFATWIEASAAKTGDSLDGLLRGARIAELARLLLAPDGLDLASRPKGLVPFHTYPAGPRHALAEHFFEATRYLSEGGPNGAACRIHFTVAEEHRQAFERAAEETAAVVPGFEFDIGFSTQEPATDTLAVDPDNRPFRHADGRLLFRPAGHGSLISNLEKTGGDVVFIKNIDNVTPSRGHELTAEWKRRLAGLLVRLEQQTHEWLDRLEGDADENALGACVGFLAENLALAPPADLQAAEPDWLRSYLIDRLDRPMRVCGVVLNEGEPGGGPFWIENAAGEPAGQIVESAQVDVTDPAQRRVWESSTHFNPVDLVCALRDRHGRPYELDRFVDPDACFLSKKSHDGRPLKALERPGLWNGAMAGWNTAFVEVPPETFTPVKTILDLLRPEHQPGDG